MPDRVPLTLPAMGESVTEGTVARWAKAVGDDVAEGETVVEVTTDKVDVEVPAPAAGTLAEIVANEGDTVAVGGTLGLISAGSAAGDTPLPAPAAAGGPGGPGAGEGAAVAESPPVAEAQPADAEAPSAETQPVDAEPPAVEAQPADAEAPAAETQPVDAEPPAVEAQPADAPPSSPPAEAAAETVEVTLPAMGESVTEGTVARWVKKAGDSVSEGETVAEVTTDKVDVEVPAPVTGTIETIVADEGATVAVGGVLARIAPGSAEPAPAEARPQDSPAAEKQQPSPAPEPPQAAPPAPERDEAPRPGANGQGPASPLARRAAARSHIDLGAVAGSGPGGLVRRADLKQRQEPAATDPSAAGPQSAPTGAAADARTQPIRGPQAALVDYMEQSLGIPTATSFRTIPVAVLDARRRELNAALVAAGKPTKVSFTHLIGHAIARAATEMPQMCAHFARGPKGEPMRVEAGVNLGLAVDSRRKDGTRFLVVPVVKDAAAGDFASFHTDYERLIDKARTNALSADDLRGASLTLTNPGGIGTVASVPRLMPGQGCIIAAGAIVYPPEYRHLSEGRVRELGVGKVMTLTSTYDHRIIQGAESGEFLARLEALLSGADDFYSPVFASLGLKVPSGDVALPQPAVAAQPAPVTNAPQGGADASRQMLAAMQAATSLIKAHRTHGMLGAHLDPLGTPPIGDPAMEPETYHLTPEIMERIPADLLRVYVPGRTLAEVLPNLRKTYCGTIAYEIEHISSHEQRVWLREHIESGAYRLPFSEKEKLRLLHRLTKVDAMERYFRRAFLGQKTYSGEGLDMMVPMLEKLLAMCTEDNIGEVVMGMAHRGRLATIAHVVNRPYEALLQAFEKGELRQQVGVTVDDPTGDVKYHIGATGTYITDTGKAITVRMLPNPSHLEAVNGVVEGWTRAEQTRRNAPKVHVDPTAAIPVLIHGDAAFTGQGVVPEVLNLQSLRGYTTGGTVHIISNNQVGFTTDPRDARSTRFASDMAKGFDIPIVHVNADDAEACIAAVRFGYDYRRTYHRDVVIDLIGYRRFGHNETDEPSYTQPLMYKRIREHPTVLEIFVKQLTDQGLITAEEAQKQSDEVYAKLAAAHKRVKASLTAPTDDDSVAPQSIPSPTDDLALATGVSATTLTAITEQLLSVPDDFTVSSKLQKQMERRRAALTENSIDWGHAESLAFGSLLLQGTPIRLTGQDTERGTFSHRHLVLHDERDDRAWIPMQHLVGASAGFEVYNSPLSEVGCLSFEYGYSATDPDALVLWEAQFGDFANNAQMVVDQFIVAGQAKWGLRSRLTLLLPHGYEGQGPEHSSARLERYLQLAAYGNIRVANCTTAAQYFHLLRNQALSPIARPLVIMTPKSLLRAREAGCSLDDLVSGHFQPVIDDPVMVSRREQVRTLLLCTGKIYWELAGHELREHASDLAIARIELLDPLPVENVLKILRRYPNLEELIWVQEEPDNMGAWNHLQRPIGKRRPYELRWEYVGRPRRASPSEGFHGSHALEQERIIRAALGRSLALQEYHAGAASPAAADPAESKPSAGVRKTQAAAAKSDAS